VYKLRWRLCSTSPLCDVGCLASCSSGLCKSGWQHWRTTFWVMLVEYRVVIFRVKPQGLDFIGYTWQWPCWRFFFFELNLSPWWKPKIFDWAMIMLVHCFLPQVVDFGVSFIVRMLFLVVVRVLLLQVSSPQRVFLFFFLAMCIFYVFGHFVGA
jgi:hypothetical protein